jgi:hypothetical protein
MQDRNHCDFGFARSVLYSLYRFIFTDRITSFTAHATLKYIKLPKIEFMRFEDLKFVKCIATNLAVAKFIQR